MLLERIRERLKSLRAYYQENPQKAVAADKPATVVIESGLKCRASGPNDAPVLTDMPKGVGGSAAAPTPGWYLRAAIASCNATMIQMRAAECGVELSHIEVQVESDSDNRGILGTEGSPVGPLEMNTTVRVRGNATADELREIVAWAEAHSPVADAVRRATPAKLKVEILEKKA